MKDIIQDRLGKIANLNDRRLLRNVLYDVYENVVDYNMEMYARLEKRIYDEIEDPSRKFYVCASLDHIRNIDRASDFLHPMAPEDLDETVYNMADMTERLQSDGEITLARVFMACGADVIARILERERTYKGYVKTDRDIYEINVILRRCRRYLSEIEKLYKVFQRNGVLWNTINCPYAYKFLDVILRSSLPLKPGESVKEITVDLAEYDRYKMTEVAPLWNIKRVKAEDKSFPMPAEDRINYDHVISLTDTGVQNGYLVELGHSGFFYCKRLESDLVIVSPLDEQHVWSLLQIENISNSRQKNYPFELLSNRRDLGFTGRYAGVKSMTVRTKGEIVRLTQSYELKDELELMDAEILESYEKTVQTVDLNYFIDDNIRVDTYKKVMLVKFRAADRNNYLIQEKLSFLTSELQVLFPEYRCVGELV